MGGKGGIRAGKKKGGITISMYSVCGGAWRGLCNTEKTSNDSTTPYYAEGQTAIGFVGGT